MIELLGALCPLLGILLGVALLYGCEDRTRPIGSVKAPKLDPPNPTAPKSDPNPTHQPWYTP